MCRKIYNSHAERQKAYKERKKAKLRTPSLTPSPTVTVTPVEIIKEIPSHRHTVTPSISNLDSLSLFPLSIQEVTSARVDVHQEIPPAFCLTSEMEAYAMEWSGWPLQRVRREFEKFTAHYQASGRIAKSWQAMWRAWVMRGIERDEAKAPIGSIEDRFQREAQALQALRSVRNGHEMRHGNGSSVRGQVIQLLRGNTGK